MKSEVRSRKSEVRTGEGARRPGDLVSGTPSSSQPRTWRFLLLVALLGTANGQSWVARYNGPANDEDVARAVAVDGSGLAYVTGSSWGTGTEYDWATIKYNTSGETLWVARFDGDAHGTDEARALALRGGLLLVAGGRSAADFTTDMMTIAYNAAGAVQWAMPYDGPVGGNDLALAAALDSLGSACVAGYASGDTTGWDMTTVQYTPAGAQHWVGRYSTVDEDYATGLAADAAGNVFVAGVSGSPYTSSWDYVTIKYDTGGQEQWVARFNGPGDGSDIARGIGLDPAGNPCVTGASERPGTGSDFTTIKYNSVGETLWLRTYDGPANGQDGANAIFVGSDGSVYVAGYSQDPTNDLDFAAIKYDAAGNRQWVARYDGPGHGFDEARAIAVDAGGNVYVTGTSTGAGGGSDYATVKYNALGGEEWVHRYDGPDSRYDEACALALDPLGGVCAVGTSTGLSSGSDYATVRYPRVGIAEERPSTALKTAGLHVSSSVFCGAATVSYDLAVRSRVHLTVCDAVGRTSAALDIGSQPAGTHTLGLPALRPGIYFIRLLAQGTEDGAREEFVCKLILAR